MGKNKKNKRKSSNVNRSNDLNRNKSFHEKIIKELALTTKANGLVVGTNEVLRRLRRDELAVVFFFSKTGSQPVYQTLSMLCKSFGVEFVTLQENDKYVLGPAFPKSYTYGIKKTSLEALPTIADLLEKLKSFKKVKQVAAFDINREDKILNEENTHLHKINITTDIKEENYYHKKHTVKKIKTKSEDKAPSFISLVPYAKPNIDFPVYDSNLKSIELSICIK